MSVELLTFDAALAQTVNMKRHLLLGNGFSIALFPDRFRYGSLLEEADFTGLIEARQAFDALTTTDFEAVIHALRQVIAVVPLYSPDTDVVNRISNQAEALKELLVQAIAGRHPERPSDITELQYVSCRTFLAHFAGEPRDRSRSGGKDLRGNIYSVNYDLLLYWVLLHDQITLTDPNDPWTFRAITMDPIQHDDGFRSPDEEPDAAYVAWDGEEAHQQNIHYLHGALHLYDYGHQLQKKCWERSGGIPLVNQIRDALNEGRFPLFVAEGNSKGKFERIRHSGYLHKALRSFRGNCDVKSATLFIFGHSLAENDVHIIDQIRKGKIQHVYISLHGDPQQPWNQQIIAQANDLGPFRPERYPLTVQFFDAASARVSGRDHTLTGCRRTGMCST